MIGAEFGVLFCLLWLFGTRGDVGPRRQQGTCDRFVSDRYLLLSRVDGYSVSVVYSMTTTS